jgi:hypothetical protein
LAVEGVLKVSKVLMVLRGGGIVVRVIITPKELAILNIRLRKSRLDGGSDRA